MLESVCGSPAQWVPGTPFLATCPKQDHASFPETPVALVPDTGQSGNSPEIPRTPSVGSFQCPSLSPLVRESVILHGSTPLNSVHRRQQLRHPSCDLIKIESPKQGENGDQLVPATPKSTRSFVDVTNETKESSLNVHEPNTFTLTHSSYGRRTPRLLSPTNTKKPGSSVLNLFTGDDFFD